MTSYLSFDWLAATLPWSCISACGALTMLLRWRTIETKPRRKVREDRGLRSLATFLGLLFSVTMASLAFGQENRSVAVLKPGTEFAAGKRFALVIGNGSYQNVQSLRNPKHDAAAVAAKLQLLGYQVVYALDVDRREMNGAVDAFLSMIQPGSEALVYYSGHGVDLNGSNYLLPIDIAALDPEQERRLRVEGLNVNDLLLDLQAKSARVNIVILDACRDNPFRAASRYGATRSLGSTRGLAAIEPSRGTFIMFAAGVGEQALDNLGSNDPDPNGLFTRKFLTLLDQDGLEIHSLVLRLRAQVQEAALTVGGHSQTPGYYDQLLGEFYFRPKAMEPEAEQAACQRLINEHADKDAILAADVDAGVQACARAVVDHPAEAGLTHLMQVAGEQRILQMALRSNERSPSDAYLLLYPTGRFAADVKQHLVSLTVIPTPLPPPTPQPSPVEPPKPKVDTVEVARVLQVELKRVGCDPLSIDGDWGVSSERAMKEFDRQTHNSLDVKVPSLEAIEAVRSKTERVCVLGCGVGRRAEGDQCVAVGCKLGEVLNAKGICQSKIRPIKPIASNAGIKPIGNTAKAHRRGLPNYWGDNVLLGTSEFTGFRVKL